MHGESSEILQQGIWCWTKNFADFLNRTIVKFSTIAKSRSNNDWRVSSLNAVAKKKDNSQWIIQFDCLTDQELVNSGRRDHFNLHITFRLGLQWRWTKLFGGECPFDRCIPILHAEYIRSGVFEFAEDQGIAFKPYLKL